jgi:hypothetical protein
MTPGRTIEAFINGIFTAPIPLDMSFISLDKPILSAIILLKPF